MCIQMCAVYRHMDNTLMCTGMCTRHVHGHVYGHVYRHVYGDVYEHVNRRLERLQREPSEVVMAYIVMADVDMEIVIS